jgi:hypothetical protein
MIKQMVAHPFHGMQLRNEKAHTTDTHNSLENYTKGKIASPKMSHVP